jgi:hypothetical protein
MATNRNSHPQHLFSIENQKPKRGLALLQKFTLVEQSISKIDNEYFHLDIVRAPPPKPPIWSSTHIHHI